MNILTLFTSFQLLADTIIIALLVFLVLHFIKKSQAIPVVIGVGVLGIVYELSVIFNLSLTRYFFQSFFGIVVLVMVIIFQREIRRFFEALSLNGFTKKSRPISGSMLTVLLDSIEYLRKKKHGALLVLPGKENIDRFLEGGFYLRGSLSKPLIVSLFDDSTPGHDGAVVFRDNLVERFGVHLPLARNTEYIRKFGTRHRAGLGITEVADCLVIIISEERGTVSIAEGGKLEVYDAIKPVEKRIGEFLRRVYPSQASPFFWSKMGKEALLLLLSFVIAAAFSWVFMLQNTPVQRQMFVPVEFKNIPNTYVVEKVTPSSIVITLEGNDSDLRSINGQQLRFSLDVGGLKSGWHTLPLQNTELVGLGNNHLVNIDTKEVRVYIDQIEASTPPQK